MWELFAKVFGKFCSVIIDKLVLLAWRIVTLNLQRFAEIFQEPNRRSEKMSQNRIPPAFYGITNNIQKFAFFSIGTILNLISNFEIFKEKSLISNSVL